MQKPENFVLIIGAMKSGTTSLFDILSQHPQVCASKIKEPDYFARPEKAANSDEYRLLWDWDATRHLVALESSVAYTKWPVIRGVPERIFNSKLGTFRFIYLVRDPVKRIQSQVRHGIFAGWGKSLDEGISNDLIAFSRYAAQLDEYLRYFRKEDILVLALEEFQQYPSDVLCRICTFLEINNTFKFKNVYEPRNTGQFFESSSRIMRLTQNPLGKYVARNILPFRVKNWLRNKLVKLSEKSGKIAAPKRWQLSEAEKEQMINALMSDLKRIRDEYGIDIQNYWNISEKMLSQ